MGQSKSKTVSVKQQLQNVRLRTEDKVGKAKVTGRYHLPPKNIKDDYVVNEGKVLGTGLNGCVYLATSIQDGTEVAIKPYASVGINKEEQRVLRNEVEIFLSMDHPHIARLINVYEEPERLMLVMEVCKGGEIFEWISANGVDEKKAADLVFQMLLSVNYLHDRQIVHRDLKLENFLFETKAYEYVKLIDFGMARYWSNNRNMKLACGTVGYVAPECLNEDYTIKCDMWAMGVITYVLLCGDMPFKGSEPEQIAAIKACQYTMDAPNWANVSEKARDFVVKLMTLDVDARMSARQALEHPWIVERQQIEIKDADGVDQATVNSMKQFAQASSFKRVCLGMMSYSMTLQERKDVREAFNKFDTDQTGRIMLKDLKVILRDNCSDEEVKQMFGKLDTNSDEHISYSDFLAAMLTSKISQSESHIKAAFNRLDKDGSGEITADNLREVLGDSHNGETVEKLMKEADVSHTGTISYDEFMMYIQGGAASDVEQEAVMEIVEVEKRRSLIESKIALPSASGVPAGAEVPVGVAPADTQESAASQEAEGAAARSSDVSESEPIRGASTGEASMPAGALGSMAVGNDGRGEVLMDEAFPQGNPGKGAKAQPTSVCCTLQ